MRTIPTEESLDIEFKSDLKCYPDHDLIEEIVQESGAKHLEFELWDAADRSKTIFDELEIDLVDGEWQYDCWGEHQLLFIQVDCN